MKLFSTVTVALALGCAGTLAAQNPLSTETKGLYTQIKANLIKSAEEMPEANYSFQPTPDVRTFAQLIGHVTDAQYLFCTPVLGEKKASDAEKTMKTKTELVAAIKAAFAYCDGAYNSLTDAAGTDKVKFFGRDMTKLGVLNFNVAHDNEHYGNAVTYLRLKGLVPPSSQPSK
jgi:uncharacterized damage-inducible protein DinB